MLNFDEDEYKIWLILLFVLGFLFIGAMCIALNNSMGEDLKEAERKMIVRERFLAGANDTDLQLVVNDDEMLYCPYCTQHLNKDGEYFICPECGLKFTQ